MELAYKKLGCTQLTEAHIGAETTLAGWASTIRDLGGIIFVEFRLDFKFCFSNSSLKEIGINVVLFSHNGSHMTISVGFKTITSIKNVFKSSIKPMCSPSIKMLQGVLE